METLRRIGTKFRSDTHDFFIVLPNLNYGQKDVEYADDNDSRKNVTENVTERQHRIFDLIKQDSTISQENMAEKLGVTRRTIARDLDILRRKGMIGRAGGDYGGRWIVK